MGSSTDEMYRTITFKAETVKTLKQYIGKTRLSIPEVAKIMRSLVQQLSYLIHKESSTIIGYNLDDILVINDETVAFLGSEFVANIDVETNMAMISCPFSSNDGFFSPEMLHIKEIPSFVHYKTSYFSLACVIIYLLLGCDDEFYKEYIKKSQSKIIIEYLQHHPIKESKLYWLLIRCLVEEPKNRSILFL
jgi:serine/threonine protein kinase